ncbi:hypothetical protein [Cryobacterium sp. HLT2-28]|uniref:hypothetical protein n=1 Tax=Cryobacterium sp. HLT2-28 TaxID=1259146 RepID=UPI00106BC6F5|nr:hypothetical protein [Cryobacterium sp. HLT2-28]TFB92755.1 hypothetical protein E3O48_13385 [Cryobacterium sp. HLT2-28]
MTDRRVVAETAEFTASYDLSPDDVGALTVELLASLAGAWPEKYRYVGIEIAGESPFSNIARHIERVVFEASFGNDAAQMTAEYGPYEAGSVFFVSIDRSTGMPSGALRIIGDSPRGFKTLNDARSAPFHILPEDVAEQHAIDDRGTLWDVGTVAVLPGHRSGAGAVSVQLYRAMYLSALQHGIDHLVSIIDAVPLRKLVDYLGIPFVPLAGSAPGPYLGSPMSQAVYCHVPDFQPRTRRHRWTVRGFLARKALSRLARGSDDDALSLIS